MPPWSKIDTVIFDMDGTVLDLHFDNYFWHDLVPEYISRQTGLSRQDALTRLMKTSDSLRGTLNWYCLDYWTEELSLDLTVLKEQVRHKISIRPHVEHLLGFLRQERQRLLLVTNAHPFNLQLKLTQTGIGEYFHNCISSHTLKLAKENQGFWGQLQKLEHFEPERTLLIDDNLSVLQQARREGIKHLYGITKPDSQKPDIRIKEFPQIEDFRQIIPSLET